MADQLKKTEALHLGGLGKVLATIPTGATRPNPQAVAPSLSESESYQPVPDSLSGLTDPDSKRTSLPPETVPVRKQTLTARVSEDPSPNPSPIELPAVLGRTDLLWTAKRRLAYTIEGIAEMAGVSRPTVEKVFRLEPSVSFFAVCMVVNILRLEMADVFPRRCARPKPSSEAEPIQWSKGRHHRRKKCA